MKRLSLLIPGMLLVAGGFFVGCENQIETPEAMTLQTRSAVEVLPAHVQVVGMANLEAMQRNSAINPFEEMDAGTEFSARIQAFIDATGFDPQTDLREVYFAADNLKQETEPNFVAYATFDRARLQEYVEQNMSDAFSRTDYKGVTIYRATEDEFAFALATDNMVIGSSRIANVEAMLDRLSGQGESLKDNAETMKLIETASGSSSAWFVIRDIEAEFGDEQHGDDPIERDVEMIGKALKDVAMSLTMEEDGAEGRVVMTTRDGVSSDDVASLTKGVVAAMKASAKAEDGIIQMLDQVHVRTQGDHVRVNFFVTNDMLAASR